MGRILKLLNKTAIRESEEENTSAVFFDDEKKVLDLRKKTPIFEFHFDLFKNFFKEHKKNLLVIVSFVLCFSVFISFFRTYASVATFYPKTCLGGWEHPSLASGEPSLTPDAPQSDFNHENSAYTKDQVATLYCGEFSGEIPNDTTPNHFELSFSWSIDNGTIEHVSTPSSPVVIPASETGDSSPAPDSSVLEAVPNAGTEGLPPEDSSAQQNESVKTPEPSSAPVPAASEPEPTSFLEKIFSKKVFAEESPALEVIDAGAGDSLLSAPALSPTNDAVSDTQSAPAPAPAPAPEPTPTTSDSSPAVNESTTSAPVIPASDAAPALAPVAPSDISKPLDISNPDKAEGFLEVLYTLDGTTWKSIGLVDQNNWKHATFDIPLTSWNDLSHFQVAVKTISRFDLSPAVYVDSMHLDVSYEDIPKEASLPTIVLKDSSNVIDGDQDFASNDDAAFTITDPEFSTTDITNLVKEKRADIISDPDRVITSNIPDAQLVNDSIDDLIDATKKYIPVSTNREGTVVPVLSPIILPPADATGSIDVGGVSLPALAPTTEKNPSDSLPLQNKISDPKPVSFLNFLKPSIARASFKEILPVEVEAGIFDAKGAPADIPVTITPVTIDGKQKNNVLFKKPDRSFLPGRYTVRVKMRTESAIIITEQDFTWGVLAVNTDRTVYSVGSNVYLQMGVLSDEGETICNGDLDLTIKDPSGGIYTFTTGDKTIVREVQCGPNNVIEVPDYYAHFVVPNITGSYSLKLTSHTMTGSHTISDRFDVVSSSVAFDVVRQGPTRINPIASYPVTLRINPSSNWSGVIQEKVPASFVIHQPAHSLQYDTVDIVGDTAYIKWNVSLVAGKETVIGYRFMAPLISPEFYLLGALEFYSESQTPNVDVPEFTEIRKWQIAADAVCTAAANGNWNTPGTWSCSHVPTNADSVVINSSVTVTMDVASANALQGVTINGTLTTSGSNYALNTTTLIIGATGTLTANASVITLSGSGTLFTITAGGTFTQGTSEVVVTAPSGAVTLLSAATTFHKLTINSNATVINAGAPITMSSANSANKLYIQKGVLNDGGNQITGTSNGTLVVDAGGALCIGGTAASSNATCDSGATPTTATTFPTNYTNGNITLSMGSTTGSWYNASWGYRTKITIDHTKVPNTDQTDFPVLISKTDTRFKTVANGGHMGNSDASDMLFTSSDGTTKLKHEVEFYVATTGQIIAWVKIPTLSHTTDTDIYVYYGNAGVAAQADAVNTWSNHFKQVLHVPDGTTLSTNDSTGTYNGTNNGGAVTTGIVDGGIILNTLGNRIDNSNGLYTMIGGSATHTESLWVRVDNTGFGGGTNYIFDGDHNNAGQSFANIGNATIFQWGYGGFGSYRQYTLGTTLAVGTWAYISMVKSAAGDNGDLYVNGVRQTSWINTLGNLPNNTTTSHWGNYHASSATTLQGAMDEMRISDVNRSGDWIATEYNNMNSPSTFTPTWATEEVGTIPDATVYYNADAATTVSSTPTYATLKLNPQLTAARTYTLATGALTVNGDLSINPSRSSSALLTVNAGGDITVASTKTTTLTKTSSATSKLVLRPSSTDYNLTTGFLNVATGATLDATSAASTITLNGISGTLFTYGGTFTQGNSTVAVTSASGPVALLSAAATFHILKINSASSSTVVNTAFTPTIEDTSGAKLYIQSGVLNDSGLGITTSGSTTNTLQIDSGGTLCLGGAAGANTATTCDTSATSTTARSMPAFQTYTLNAASTVLFLSDAATTVSNTPAYGNLKLNPVITAGRTYTLGGAMTINGNWTMSPNSSGSNLLTINAAGTMTVATTGTTTISRQGSTATSKLVLRPSSTDYNISSGWIVIGTGGTLDGTSASSTITLTGISGTLFTPTGTYTRGTTEVIVTSASGTPTLLSTATTFHKLTINSAATIINDGAIVTINNVSGARLYVQSGVFNSSTQLSGPGSGNGTLQIDSGGTFCLGGTTGSTVATCNSGATSASAITMPTFQTYTFDAASTVIYLSDAATTVSEVPTYGNLKLMPLITAARTYTNGSAVMTIAGNYDINPNSAGSNLLTVNAAGSISVGTTKTITITRQGSTATSSLAIHPGVPQYNLSAGFITIATGGKLDCRNTTYTGTITVGGTSGTLFSNNGTFTQGNSTVLAGSPSGTPSFFGGAVTTFHIVKISSAATVINAGAGFTLDNTSGSKLWVASGVFNQENRTITPGLTATLQLDSGTTLCLGGTTAATNATCDSGATQNTAQSMPGFIGFSFDPASTVEYLSDANTTVAGAPSYGHLKFIPLLTSGRVYTLSSAMTILGNFDIRPNAAGASLLTVNTSGDISVPAANTTTIGRQGSTANSSLVMNPSGTSYNLTTGYLAIPSGGTLDCTSTTTTTITIAATSGTLFTKTGSFAITGGTPIVDFTGNGSATLNSGSITFYDFKQSGTGTKTVASSTTLTINHNFTVNAGTFDPNASTVTAAVGPNILAVGNGATILVDAVSFAGSYSGFATRSLSVTSTVDYKRNGTQTIDATLTYGNLTTSGTTGTKTISNATVANNNITLNGSATLDTDAGSSYPLNSAQIIFNGGTLNANNSTIGVSGTTGTPITYTSGTFNGGTSTVVYSGDYISGNTTVETAITYYSLMVSNSAETYVLNGNATLGSAGTLTVSDGTFDTTGSNWSVSMGYLSIANSATAIFIANASTLTVAGTTGTILTRGTLGTFTGGTSILTLSGNGTATVNSDSFNGSNKFGTLVSSGTGTKTLGADIEAGTTITITAGTFDTGPSGILTSPKLTIGAAGTFTANITNIFLTGTASGVFTLASGGTFNSGTSTVIFNGNGSINPLASGTFTGGNAFNNVTISPTITTTRSDIFNSAATVVNGNFTIQPFSAGSNTLTVTLGGALTVGVAKTLTVDATGSSSSALTTAGFAVGSGFLVVGGTATLNAGSSTITLSGATGSILFQLNPGGTFNAGTSTVIINPDVSAGIYNGTFTGTNAFYNLNLTPTITLARTYGMGPGAVDINGDFTINPTASSTLTLLVNLQGTTTVAAGKTLTIDGTTSGHGEVDTTSGGNFALATGTLVIGSSGMLDANASAITVAKDWTNNGTFNQGTSAVTFNTGTTATVDGSTTFYDLIITHTSAKEVDFAASGGTPTFTVQNAFTLTGHAGGLIKLRSLSSPTKWDFLPSTTATVDYVDVQDGGCHSGSIMMTPSNSTNSGNNDYCWNFTPIMVFDIDVSISGSASSAPYMIPLGVLTTAAVKHSDTSSINMIVLNGTTSAVSGMNITVQNTNGSGGLTSTAVPGDHIPSATATMAAGSANYGLCVDSATLSGFTRAAAYVTTCSLASGTNDVVGLTSSPANIVGTSGAVTGAIAEVVLNASISPVTPAHTDYTDVLTFIATGSF